MSGREPTPWEVFNSGRAFSAWALDQPYQPPDDRGDTTIPGEFPIETAGQNAVSTTSDLFDLATETRALPWWTEYAAVAVVLLVALAVIAPYATLGAEVVD
jgi:hypothetical protein